MLPSHPVSRQSVISLDKVSLSYESERGALLHVLDEISVELYPGELVAILGPSGCGKSSLLSLIPGLNKPSGGRVPTAFINQLLMILFGSERFLLARMNLPFGVSLLGVLQLERT